MSADHREVALQALPLSAQPFARRLFDYSSWHHDSIEKLKTIPPSRRTQRDFDVIDRQKNELLRTIANAFFEDAAVLRQQIDSDGINQETQGAINLFMLQILYADNYGRHVVNEKIPNIRFTIAKQETSDPIDDQSANIVTLHVSNPDNPTEVIEFQGRFAYLLKDHNSMFPQQISGGDLFRLLRKSRTEIIPEEPQESWYRMALEIPGIDYALLHLKAGDERKNLRERKIRYLQQLLAAREKQLEQKGQEDFEQTIFLGNVRAYRQDGRRDEYYDLVAIDVIHPRYPKRHRSLNFLPLTDGSYSREERSLLQPKIIRSGFDFEDTRRLNR